MPNTRKLESSLVSVTMDAELLAALECAALEAGSNRSEMVRRCCALFLSEGALHQGDDRAPITRALFADRCRAPLAAGTKGGWPAKRRKTKKGIVTDLDTIREIQRLMDGSRGAAHNAPANEKKIAGLLGIAPEPGKQSQNGKGGAR